MKAEAEGISKHSIKEVTIKTRLDSAVKRPLDDIPDSGSPISCLTGEKFRHKIRKVVQQVRDITYFGSLLANFHVLRLVQENRKLPKLDSQFYQQCFRTLCGKSYEKKPCGNLRLLMKRYIQFRKNKNQNYWEKHLMKLGIQETFDTYFSHFDHFQELKKELKTLDCSNLSSILSIHAQSLATGVSNHVQENYDKLITRYDLLYYY